MCALFNAIQKEHFIMATEIYKEYELLVRRAWLSFAQRKILTSKSFIQLWYRRKRLKEWAKL